MPHDIIRAEMGAAPIIIKALFQSVISIQQFWEIPKQRYSTSKQIAEHGDIHCWYAETQQWFKLHGISINALHSNRSC